MAETSRAIRIWTGSWLSYLLTFSVLAISGLTNPFPLSWGDAFAYLTPAKNLVFRNELVYDNIWTGIAPPLYPALLVPGVAVAQDWSELTKLIALLNSVAFAAIVFPIYGIAKKLGLSNPTIFAACVIICINPSSFQYTQDLMSENLYLPLFAIATVFFLLEKSVRNLFLFSGVAVAMVMTKPIAIVAVGAIALVLSIDALLARRSTTALAFLCGGLVLPLLFLVGWQLLSPRLSSIPQDFQGRYPGGYLDAAIWLSTTKSGLEVLGVRLFNLARYTLYGTYFLPLAFLFPRRGVGARLIRIERFALCLLIVWLAMAAITSAAQNVFFKNVSDPHFYLYGRYIDPILPVILICSLARVVLILEDSKNDTKKHICILTVGALLSLLLLTFPSDYWKGISSGALAPYILLMDLVESRGSISRHLITAGIFLALLALVVLPQPKHRRSAGVVAFLGLLSFLSYGSYQETQRVNPYKRKWSSHVTDLEAYQSVPPSSATAVFLDSASVNRKLIWYMGYIYFKSQISVFDPSRDNPPPPGSIIVTQESSKPRRTRACGKCGEGCVLYCREGSTTAQKTD